MKQPNSINAFFCLTALSMCLAVLPTHAAVRTWSGAGTDDNWNTPANWGGTAPVNVDILIFSGTTRQNNTNNISNLSVNGLSFANNGFTLNGTNTLNTLSLNGAVTNSAGTNTVAQSVNVTASNPTWNIAAGSELRFSGFFSNTTTANPLATMSFGGTVRFLNNSCLPNRFFTLTSGSVIADGCNLTTLDGFRVQPPTGSTAVFQITNNASFTIGSGGNLRLCQTATGGSSRVDMSSGILNLAITSGAGAGDIFVGEAASTTTVFNHNGGLVEFTGNGNNRIAFANASASANGTYNLNGGVLWTKQIVQVTAGSPGGTFNFNGGILKPTTSSTTFFQGVQTANVQAGGAIIDTTNLTITIAQNLTGGGPLIKLGSGTLTLSGTDSYSGTTVVSNGTLAIVTGVLTGGGGMTVADGATLMLTNTGTTMNNSTLTLGASSTNTVKFIFPGGNPGAATISCTTLAANGYAVLNISGALTTGSFPLINFTSASGLANLHLVTPPGVVASLVTSGSSVSVNITSIGKALAWSGATDANWNTSTVNWFDLGNGNNPTNYTQPGGFGDLVTFDDGLTANPNVNLALAVSPVTMTLNNNATVYTFTGAGKISGVGRVTKGGFQSVTFGTANDYSGGTMLNAGIIYCGANQALGTGTATLTLGTLASDSTTARTLSNPSLLNADLGVIFGDTVNTGTLTLAGGLDLGGGLNRNLNLNSDLVISGPLTNGALATKTGPGTLYLRGNTTLANNAIAQQQGDIVVDSATVSCFNGWRLQCTTASGATRLVVTNGGVLRLSTGVNTGNLRVGLSGGDNSADNIADISGTVDLTLGTGPLAGNNAVSLGQSGANAILYLRSGGLLITRALFGLDPGNAEAHFMGGTIRAIANDTGFISGLTNAFIEDGGLSVDTTNFTVTIPQPLLASGTGGLTKIGTGTLTLTGSNTYSGTTIVNAGKLILTPAHAATGGITVNANSTLAFLQSSPPAKVNVPNVTIGGANCALEVQLSVTNAAAAVITNLNLSGSVAVNVTGSFGVGQFPLFGYGAISGGGGLTLGSVPLGTVGHLVTNTPNKTIDLVVSAIAKTVWKGNVSGNWDTATTNWTISSTPVAYAQGANVLFDDTASNFGVSLTTTLTPSTMIVSNVAQSYTFSGAGFLSGNMTLVKDGTNTATISAADTYTGNTTIKAGTIVLGNATALGASSATVTIQNGATLSLAGNAPGLQPIVVGGSGTDGNGALVNDTVDQNNALRAVTLTTNTTIRTDALIGIRMPAETDPGLNGNGFKLIKTGSAALNLNGGQTAVTGTTVWDSDLGDIDVQQGILSFERRMTMGRATNTITVQPGATLKCFSLNTNVLPLQVKPIHLVNATLGADTAVAGDFVPIGCPVTVDAGTNFVTSLAGGGSGGCTFVLEGPISGAGSVYYSGTNQLTGTNTYTGSTVVTAGILQLVGTGSIANSAAVLIQSDTVFDVSQVSPWTLGGAQTLGGNGTVNGNVQANGTVSPGASIGALAFNDDLTLAGTNVMELTKDGGLTNDVITVAGTLTYGGRLNVLATGGTPFAVDDTFKLFNFSSAPGGSFTFSLPAGYTWDTSQLAVDGTIKVSAVTTRPRAAFTSVATSGNSIILSGTNATGSYVLYSSTNVALPLSSWTPVQTNTFSGPFSFTNAMDVPKKFYLLQ